MSFFTHFWGTMAELAPALFLGLLTAAMLHVLIRRDRVFSHLGRPGLLSVIKSSLLGVPLPLCSCGVIPAAMALRREGASRGATVAFLVSTPQTGVDSVFVTSAMLGWPVAVAKLASAFAAGVAAGAVTDASGGESPEPPPLSGACAMERRSVPARIWDYAFGTILRDMYRWLLLGVAVSALIGTLVPPGTLAASAVLRGPLGILAALVVGIPLYVCSTASVPIAAGLVTAGLSPGAALVFLMAGPATNAATMVAVRKILGGRVFIVYMTSIVLFSVATGLVLDDLMSGGSIPSADVHSGHAHPGLLPQAAAALLSAGILWWAFVDLRLRLASWRGRRGRSFDLAVSGMSCRSCEERVRTALTGMPGVGSVEIDRESGRVRVFAGQGVDPEKAAEVVRAKGYGARRTGPDGR